LSGGKVLATVLSGGNQFIRGTAIGGAVSSGGRETVSAGGVASGITVKSGGNQIVLSGGVTRGTVVSGGAEIVSAGGSASGTTLGKGGSAIVHGRASGGTITGGIFEVASGGTASGTVNFISGGTLRLDAGAGFTGVIKGFGKPSLLDQIDLRGIAFSSSGTTRSFVEAASKTSGTLTVTSGTHAVKLTLLGVYTTSNFKLANDTHGGTLVTDPPVAGGAPRTTFADIAPAGPRAGAPDAANSLSPLAANLPAPAGALLLATGPPAGPGIGDHNPLPPAPS
jgi:autotransporter passenger strand-loop-strand repeat protein